MPDKNNFTWNASLREFFRCTNENERYRAFLGSVIGGERDERAFFAGQSELAWIDIGPGSGEKSVIIDDLLSQFTRHRVIAMLVEPDKDFAENLRRIRFNSSVVIKASAIESLTYSDVCPPHTNRILISAIQVLYETEITRGVMQLLGEASERGVPTLLIAGVESSKSDLRMARQQIGRSGVAIPEPAQLPRMLKELQAIGYRCSVTTLRKELRLTRSDIGWLCVFLLGIDNRRFNSLAQELKDAVYEIAKALIDQSILGIDDDVLVATYGMP